MKIKSGFLLLAATFIRAQVKWKISHQRYPRFHSKVHGNCGDSNRQGRNCYNLLYNSFIKIINDTHFAFLQHDLNKGKDSTAVFASGGGRYLVKDSLYTEHLEYCSDRNWEGNDFNFTVTIKNDTLT